MQIKVYPVRFNNYSEALKAAAVLSTQCSMDAMTNLFDDMSTAAFYDAKELVHMFSKVIKEGIIAGTVYVSNNNDQYFISNDLISELLDFDRGVVESAYGNFSRVAEALIDGTFGQEVLKEFGNKVEMHFHKIKPE